MNTSKALWKKIDSYSPRLSDESEREKLEALGVQFTKCGSCGNQYPEQRVDEVCDQCEDEGDDNMTVNEQELVRHIETLQNKVDELEAEIKKLKKK
jgi:DNA repair exonuclease SbcCD ATPase subunit